jgi:hypothetical protein
MSFSRAFVATAVCLLMGGVALAAPSARKQTADASSSSPMMKSTTHHQWGVVDSMTDTDLTLTHTYKGKTESVTFKVDANTKKVGDVNQGSHVEVYYKNENGEHVATEIKARKTKSKM